MNLKQQMDAIYGEVGLDRIPWNLTTPPDILVDLVRTGRVTPCEAVDLGCGAGNYSIWLAAQGFSVTGLDFSPKAIDLARSLALEQGVECNFAVHDLLRSSDELSSAFDFAFEWEVLHHIFPENRENYVGNVHRMLRANGRYLSVCFGEEDASFGGRGKYRQTPMNTTLYFSSEEELRELLEPHFEIEELRTTEIPGKTGPHLAIVALALTR